MSEDIHKWSDGRYTLMFDEHTFFVFDNEKEERMTALETTKRLNEQQSNINKKKELLKLIANACSFNKEHSVKEILRNEIKGIDTVTYESANAWHDYVLLSEFFEECYGESASLH